MTNWEAWRNECRPGCPCGCDEPAPMEEVPTGWYPGVAMQQPDGTAIHTCPVDDCDWSWTEAPVQVQPGTLAGIFGTGSMLNMAVNQRAQRIEDALAEHFAAHPVADFVRTIMRLRREREGK